MFFHNNATFSKIYIERKFFKKITDPLSCTTASSPLLARVLEVVFSANVSVQQLALQLRLWFRFYMIIRINPDTLSVGDRDAPLMSFFNSNCSKKEIVICYKPESCVCSVVVTSLQGWASSMGHLEQSLSQQQCVRVKNIYFLFC